mmetsp:Transcript_46298/g.104349  ORF Transcript_46298/g.104349 Transcript_46298/m.104349 type:complete len:87 (+) Transcript_46298:380-640(+)
MCTHTFTTEAKPEAKPKAKPAAAMRSYKSVRMACAEPELEAAETAETAEAAEAANGLAIFGVMGASSTNARVETTRASSTCPAGSS